MYGGRTAQRPLGRVNGTGLVNGTANDDPERRRSRICAVFITVYRWKYRLFHVSASVAPFWGFPRGTLRRLRKRRSRTPHRCSSPASTLAPSANVTR